MSVLSEFQSSEMGGAIEVIDGNQTVGVEFSVPERILVVVLSSKSIFFVCLLLSQTSAQYSAVP